MAAPATLFRCQMQNGNHTSVLHFNGDSAHNPALPSFKHLLPKPEQLPAWAGSSEIPKANSSLPLHFAKTSVHTHLPGETPIAVLPPNPIKVGALKATPVKTAAPATTATTTVPAKIPSAPAAQPSSPPVGYLTMGGVILSAFIVIIALFNIADAIGAKLSGKKAK